MQVKKINFESNDIQISNAADVMTAGIWFNLDQNHI